MYTKKKCVAMLLAGGQGSRLYALTKNVAKPAVPYGGKYRLIDFPLSNCTNSGIDTVGVLTQYQPLVLNEYIGNGQPWDLDKMNGGVHVLPPYETQTGASWYEGTANAIYQNMRFIERYDPEYVVVLGGDHIYKMDYSKMVDFHVANNADCTISVIDVPKAEASRFGIMICDEKNQVTDFVEKPKEPKSTLASMGIYVFTWEKLRKYLIENENDANAKRERGEAWSKDFGKDIITSMLRDKQRLFAYEFEGYWKDVGTISSLWESNMDLLGKNPKFNLFDKSWRIYYRHEQEPPQRINAGADVQNSFVTEGCNISGKVYNSVLSNSVTVEKGAIVRDSVIMSGVVIKSGAVVDYTIIDHDTVIEKDAEVGDGKEKNKSPLVIGADITIPKKTRITGSIIVDHDNLDEVIGKGENK